MPVDAACAYLGAVDRETFLATVAPSLQVIRLRDGVDRYDRRELDAWVDARGQVTRKRSDSDWLRDLSNA
jgi:hypothetical protein